MKLLAPITACVFLLAIRSAPAQPVSCPDVFAPMVSTVLPEQSSFRQELCLSGPWQFQPIEVPASYKRNTGTPPELPLPTPDKWDAVPLKVPSPWNVNTWGNGRKVGAGTEHPYWADSVYFPSYPAAWDVAEMGWARRTFRVPAEWKVAGGQRLLLHFDAIAGDCQVFINGKLAGSHFDQYLPFDLDITELVKPEAAGGDNEILLGIRAHKLFDQRSERYGHMRAPYPCGSNTVGLVGPWQDIYLRAVPAIRVSDTFAQPYLDASTLKLAVTLRNDTDTAQSVQVAAEVRNWINLAGRDTKTAPVPASGLGPVVLAVPGTSVNLAPHSSREVILAQAVPAHTLMEWTPGSPNLHTALVTVSQDNRPIDISATRFGWRQFKISGRDLLLNGQKIQLTGDLLHPFGPFTMSRRYAWAWYRMIQDMGGNSVRLHAQPHPQFFLDLADEMGVVVLDETAMFGSSIALNFEPDIAWRRFEQHFDDLVLRDRNHPSVLGWSFGNELFAIFNLNNVNKEDTDRWYAGLAKLGQRSRVLDPTRDWISCDGDEDLRGTLPVYSKHFGLGLPSSDRLPNISKPLMVGESGGTYYARPSQLAVFNGDAAYGSYASRNDALAIDVYDNIVHMARPRLAYFSASETAWFGIEHLPLGYHDTTRLPTLDDGIRFIAPYTDHTPGMQLERIPPYVTTFNPGWDPALPIYKPLAMFQAEKAALADPIQPCQWDHADLPATRPTSPPAASVDTLDFVGAENTFRARRLKEMGIPIRAGGKSPITLVDLDTAEAGQLRTLLSESTSGRTVLVFASDPRSPAVAALPAALTLTDRTATALTIATRDALTDGLSAPALYFAEEHDALILSHGLSGPILDQASVLLTAGNTDWSQFNNAPERAKCGAVLLYEQLQKLVGAALISRRLPAGGTLYLTTISTDNPSRAAASLWRTLFANLGVKLNPVGASSTPALQGTTVAAALVRQASAALPSTTPHAGDDGWTLAQVSDRYNFPNAAVAYVSYWINSPRATDDLLNAGPDAPRFDTLCYGSESVVLRVNDADIKPSVTRPADYRTLYTFSGIPLKKGWNHFLFEIRSSHPNDAGAVPTAAIRIASNNSGFLRSLDSAVEKPEP